MIDRVAVAAYLLTVATHASKRADEADAAVAQGNIVQIGKIVAQQERQLAGLAGMLSYLIAKGAVGGKAGASVEAPTPESSAELPQRPGFRVRLRLAWAVLWG